MKLRNLSDIKALYRRDSTSTFLYTYLRFWEYPRLERIERMIPKKGVILDLGCGYGIFSNYIAAMSKKRKVIALELNKEKVLKAQAAARLGGIQNISFDTKDLIHLSISRADIIILMHVLHHIPYEEQEKLLLKCIKKLKPKGLLIIDEVDRKIGLKLLLVFLADTMLYMGDRFFYRSIREMESLFKKFSLQYVIYNVDGKLMPFPELVYLCKK